MSVVYIIMGVSGSGKTTVGRRLAQQLEVPFYDADDFHPPVNIDKMGAGHPLVDTDRWPWLAILAREIARWSEGLGAVLACSALKEVYRQRLFEDKHAFAKAKKHFIYLYGSFEVINERLAKRKNHFFNPLLLQSQFDTLEVPSYGFHISVTQSEDKIIKEIIATFYY